MVLLEQNDTLICKLIKNDPLLINPLLEVDIIIKKILENNISILIFNLEDVEMLDIKFYSYIYIIHNYLFNKAHKISIELINVNDDIKKLTNLFKNSLPSFKIIIK
jgi:hypothetical protein